MNKLENFWRVTAARGVVAILIGSGILIVPDMARTILLLPFAIAFAILSLAAYGAIDSGLVFLNSFYTSLRSGKLALRLQSVCGLVIGALFCSILFDQVQIHWFLYLIVLQAFATAASEFVMARHTSRKHGSRWSYVAAGVALICGIGYAIVAPMASENLSPREVALLAYGYLASFGVAQLLMAGRMLYLERHAGDVALAGAH